MKQLNSSAMALNKELPVAFIFLFLCMISLTTMAADLLYVQSERAKLVSEPGFKASVITELVKGDELILLGQDKSWRQVEFQGQTGWISGLLVANKPPVAKVSHIGSDDSSVTGVVRRRASTVATAGAARGLTSEEESNTLNSDYQELVIMEAINVESDELTEFMALLVR